MHSNGPSGRVTSSAGDVDLNGDVMNSKLGRELRRVAGGDHAANLDLDQHLARVAAVVEHARRVRPRMVAL